jgi:peptide/nickel transport system substrate-binding protein
MPRHVARFPRTPRTPRTRTALATCATLATAVAAIAGCSSGSPRPVRGTDLAALPRVAVRAGGTLRWAVDSVPSTFNAFQADADDTTALVAQATLPTLFTFDGTGRAHPDPDFLRSARVVATRPRQVVDYRLAPRARWSDGHPLGAADFAAQWKALNGRDQAYWSARNDGYDRIADVRAGAGPHDVRVTFTRPYADWQALFAPLYPAATTGSPAAFNQRSRTELPVTAGPFTVKAVDAKAGRVTLARDPRWWGPRARLDALELDAVPRDRRPAELAAGHLDVAAIDPDAYRVVLRDRHVTVHRALGPSYAELALNGSSGPLADDRVRHAVARAVDRRALAAAVLHPLGLPDRPLGNHLVLASQQGYADHSGALGRQSGADAGAILAAAGWKRVPAARASAAAAPADAPAGQPRAGGVRGVTAVAPKTVLTRNGRALDLTLLLPAGSPTLDRVGGRVAAMLARVGVRTEIERVDDASFFRDHLAAGDFDLALYAWPGTAFPATDDRPIYAKPRPAADGSLTVQQNYPRVGTDRIDQLFDQAAGTLDPGARRSRTAAADARIWSTAAALPLFQQPQLVAVRHGVANAGAFGFATPRFADLGFRAAVRRARAGGGSR